MFLDRLSNEDFVYLINLCINGEIEISDLDENSIVDLALVADEEDRKLVNGDRYFWLRGVRRGEIPKFLGEFKATDFWMASVSGDSKDYSNILREFLARKFGSEYLDSLYQYHVNCALAERATLEGKLSISR